MKSNVSIIITCYNLETYLGECITSIWSQTVQPKEVILIHDGCSKANTYDDCTTVIRQKNIGVARSRGQGFDISTGSYILFVDADDVLSENYLEESLKTLDEGYDVAYPDILLWCYWGDDAPKPNRMHYAPRSISYKSMLRSNKVVATSLMKREVFDEVGGFDARLPIFEDYDFFLTAMEQGYTFKKTNTILKYRQRSLSRNHQSDDLKRNIYEKIRRRHAEA